MLSPAELREFRSRPMHRAVEFWDLAEREAGKVSEGQLIAVQRMFCRQDLFYLLVRVCGRKDMLKPWIFARCREVEADSDDILDLWAREHYKTTIKTFGLIIQDILKDPEVTIGIFSHTRPIAKAFMRMIMRELEGNKHLNLLFPDILYGENTKEAPKWSEDDGIIVKRKSNPNESTIEAWGVVEGQPTSKHFAILNYDDIVVPESVTNPEMIQKTLSSLEMSYNLIRTSGGRKRFAGSKYHFNDAYGTIVKRGTARLRRYPGTEDGTESGKPVLWTPEEMVAKRRDMGPYTFATQILLNPVADSMQGFKREWLRHYDSVNTVGMTFYICVDAASSRKKGSDYTAMMLVALGKDQNFYVVDMIRDRLQLKERADRLFAWHRKYKPLQTRYERYGMMGDIEHILERQNQESYHFEVVEVAGKAGKVDRIGRLMPLFEQKRIWLPRSKNVTDWEHRTHDLVHDFIEEEYCAFPVGSHDDMLDCLARMVEPDMPLMWPREGPAYDYTRSAARGALI